MKNGERPTAIIRTLPYGNAGKVSLLNAYRSMMRSLENLNHDTEATVYIGLAQRPTHEVIHVYLIVQNRVVCRAQLVDFVPGTEEETWSGDNYRPKFWAILTGPVSYPPEPIKMRGFQGFRYTEALW